MVQLPRPSYTPSTMLTSKTLHDFSAPSTTHLPARLIFDAGSDGIKLKTRLLNMVQASPFCGKASENAHAHLQNFLEICSSITIKGVTVDAIHLHLFLFSLLGKAKQWFYKNQESLKTWNDCSNAFLAKYFLVGKSTPFEAGF